MRVQWKDWEGWLHRFAGLHIVHLEKKNGNFDTYNSLTPNWYYKVLR